MSARIRSCQVGALGRSPEHSITAEFDIGTTVAIIAIATMMYFTGGLLAILIVRQSWRWWRARVDVDPVSERWLAEQRGARERD